MNSSKKKDDSQRNPDPINPNRIGEFVALILAGSLAASFFVDTSRAAAQSRDPRETKEALRKVLTDHEKTETLIRAFTTPDILSDLTADPAVAKSLGKIAAALDLVAKEQSSYAARVALRRGNDEPQIGG